MNDIIEEHQSALVGGKNLLDRVVISNEVIDDAKRNGKACCLFKTDFENPMIQLVEVLYYMLGRMSFSKRKVKWVRGGVESASVSVLVNGSP